MALSAAHEDAYIKCGLLHRDISASNILIDENGNGILNDWDYARTVEGIESGPRQQDRTVSP